MASRKSKKAKSDASTEAAPATATEQEQKSVASVASTAGKKATKKAAVRRVATAKRRKSGRPKGSKNKLESTARPATKKSERPRRYPPAERAKILAAAKREGLSGPAAAKTFGISQLTFYTWRRKAGAKQARPVDHPSRKKTRRGDLLSGDIAERIRQQIRARVSELLPGIIAGEIAIALEGTAPSRRRGGR